MKKFLAFLSVLFISFGTIAQYTVSVSGEVIAEETGGPLPGYEVLIMTSEGNDSTAIFTVYTNEAGIYNASFEAEGEGGTVTISVFDCENDQETESLNYSPEQNELMADFEICTAAGSCASSFTAVNIGGLTMEFSAESEAANPTFNWAFGDGTGATGEVVQHTFASEGVYGITLNTLDESVPCESTTSAEVYVSDSTINNCEAMFSYQVQSEEAPFTVSFQDESLGNPTSWTWSFGEADSSFSQNPVHVFDEAGTYQVCLIISSNDSQCFDTFCSEITLGQGGDEPCNAEILVENNEGLTVDLFASTENTQLDFNWLFGDGNGGNGQSVSHTYAEEGTYEITLITSDSLSNCYSETSTTVSVTDSSNTSCQAYFTYIVSEGNTVAFNDASYGEIDSYSWAFGDGTGSGEENPSHTYSEGGAYEVCLTVTSAECQSTYCHDVFVNDSVGENYSVYGNIFAGNQLLDNGLALLLGTENNFYTTDVVDSAGVYNFGEVPAGTYYIQAMPLPQSQYVGDYLPTYYGNTIFWDDAIEITVGEDENPFDISLVEIGDLQNGPGNILGTLISQLKSTDVSDVDIYLLDENQNPVAHTKTDENGDFSFGDIALDGYYLRVEIMGLNADPIAINLSEEDASPEIELILKDGGVLLDVDEPQLPASLNRIYPNPVQNLLRLEISALKNTKVELNVVNQLGQVVLSRSHQLPRGSKTLDVNTARLPKGLLNLVITTEDGQQMVKKFVKK